MSLHEQLDARLARMAMATQPAVAARIVELVSDTGAQVHDYARAIRSDAGLVGRLLRLVNSAAFAQRQAVTSLDRACALLGIERLKSFSLGFYLSRAASTDPSARYSRRIWGESLMRACLASELSRRLFPALAPEAFIVGLMLDAGLPLMESLAGPAFAEIAARAEPPTRQFVLEFRSLPFTHVDVVKVLAARWRLPETLLRPIEWHHTAPGDCARTDAVYRLQRVAYYAGAVHINPQTGQPVEAAPLSTIAGRVLGVDTDGLGVAVKRAMGEYQSALSLFGDVADGVDAGETLAQRVHQQLVDTIEAVLTAATAAEHDRPPRLTVGGFTVELAGDNPDFATASLLDSSGQPLLVHRFRRGTTSPESIAHAMGIDGASPQEMTQFAEQVRGLAA